MLKPDEWGIALQTITHRGEKVVGRDHEVFTVKLQVFAPNGTTLKEAAAAIEDKFFAIEHIKEGVDELLGGSSGT